MVDDERERLAVAVRASGEVEDRVGVRSHVREAVSAAVIVLNAHDGPAPLFVSLPRSR